MILAALTGKGDCFQDFAVGALYEHARGRAITEMADVPATAQRAPMLRGHTERVLQQLGCSAAEQVQLLTSRAVQKLSTASQQPL